MGSKSPMRSLRITLSYPRELHVERHVKLKDLLYSQVLEEGGTRVIHRGPHGERPREQAQPGRWGVARE